MSRELDAEIAGLLGWKCSYDPTSLIGKPIGKFHCPECGQMVIAGILHGPVLDIEIEAPYYSTDLSALMELIRSRWPQAEVFLVSEMVTINTTGEPFPQTNEHIWDSDEGKDDAERLANAVVAALRAEKEKECTT